MSNTYGFDFLRKEHLDESAIDDHEPHRAMDVPGPPELSTEELFLQAQNKPDLEKQFDILNFLQKHREAGGLAPSVIYKSTGIDLELDTKVAAMLKNNPKIHVDQWPDPENPALKVPHYSYQATYPNVRDRATLLAQINREFNGVPMRHLLDAYQEDEVAADISALVTAGDVIAVQNTEDKDKILFPRGEPFLVELDGLIAIPRPDDGTTSDDKEDMPPPTEIVQVETDVDPCPQIRRGEAVQVGGQWFRVSSAVRAGVPLSEQPSRAQAPLSVVSLQDLSKRNEVDGYIRPLDNKTLPLDAPLAETAEKNVRAAREARERLLRLAHGRTGGVAQQLLGSHAHASNPMSMAASFAGSVTTTRKRPTAKASASSTTKKQVTKEELEKAASDPSLSLYQHARRHGCTKDIREMYLKTRSLVPESDHDMHKLLLKHKLIEPDEQLRRKRLGKASNVDQQGKPKKRRYYERKNQRWTNTHLEGTDIGTLLALAQEKQKQGKSVGDGGM